MNPKPISIEQWSLTAIPGKIQRELLVEQARIASAYGRQVRTN